jgi:hypothetical protein
MNNEYNRKAPLLRFAFLTAALSMTLAIGGFIDFLATDYVTVADGQQRTVLTAERKVH